VKRRPNISGEKLLTYISNRLTLSHCNDWLSNSSHTKRCVQRICNEVAR